LDSMPQGSSNVVIEIDSIALTDCHSPLVL
jgi:hypothetical protein